MSPCVVCLREPAFGRGHSRERQDVTYIIMPTNASYDGETETETKFDSNQKQSYTLGASRERGPYFPETRKEEQLNTMKQRNVTPLVESFPRSEDQRGIFTEIRQEESVFTLYNGDKGGTFALASSTDATDLAAYAIEMGAQSVRFSFDLKVLRNA